MDVHTLENQIGKRLPEDYRNYLSDGSFRLHGTHWYQISERTPFGEQGIIGRLLTLDDFANDGINGFPDEMMLIIGDNLFGYPTCICLNEARFGHVFYYDFEQRVFWPKEQFQSMFSNLADNITQYIYDRDAGLLPQKETGLECFYHAADSFSEFLAKLEPEDAEEE